MPRIVTWPRMPRGAARPDMPLPGAWTGLARADPACDTARPAAGPVYDIA
ncbi:MAG TPA: hypothetical protein VFR67_25690 [Pilimelia sp.]|nr:hypothetical protein [Pilimelia sp.]